jgi:glycosyltransferase involved in cell wall biosynthesis
MRVVIALASNSSQISGVQRHGLNLASCLLSRREITEVHLVAAPWQQQLLKDVQCSSYSRLHLHAAHIGHSAISRNLWFYAGLPSLARSLDADIVHLAYPAPLHRRAFACPVVVTLHDLYPYDIPENFGFPKVLFNRAVLRQCLSQADAIACVSTSTLGRLRKLDERLALTKAHVVYNSIRPRRFLANESRASGIPSLDPTHPFLLCVAQHRRNKNILLVLRAMKLLWHRGQLPLYTRLLIVGIAGPETRAIESFIAAHDLARHVILTNGIPEEQLQWC